MCGSTLPETCVPGHINSNGNQPLGDMESQGAGRLRAARGPWWSVLVSGLRSSNPGNHRQELQRAGRWLHSSCTDKSTRRIPEWAPASSPTSPGWACSSGRTCSLLQASMHCPGKTALGSRTMCNGGCHRPSCPQSWLGPPGLPPHQGTRHSSDWPGRVPLSEPLQPPHRPAKRRTARWRRAWRRTRTEG